MRSTNEVASPRDSALAGIVGVVALDMIFLLGTAGPLLSDCPVQMAT